MATKGKRAENGKRPTPTKEQLAYQMKQRQAAERKRAFITQHFFPFLQPMTIHQAKTVCKVFQNDIMATFNEGMKNPVSTLTLEKKFDGEEGESAVTYRRLVAMFAEMSIADAAEIIGGMPQALEGALSVEDHTRNMTEVEWLADGTMRIRKPEEGNAKAIKRLCEKAQCNDLRQLSNGTWVAYSKKLNTENLESLRAGGVTIEDALLKLVDIVCV